MQNMPNDGDLESEEEEIVRRDACAIGFIGKPLSYSSFLANAHNHPQVVLIR
jgi:hypothetical protein